MRTQRFALALTAINLVLLLLILTGARTSPAPEKLRVRALELVDERGRVRSRLNVEPDQEVVFRMMDPDGTIRVKLGASEGGSGLLLLDEATEPGVHLIARRARTSLRPTTTSITLNGDHGRQRIIKP